MLLLDGELKVDLAGRGVFYAKLGEGMSIQVAWVSSSRGSGTYVLTEQSALIVSG